MDQASHKIAPREGADAALLLCLLVGQSQREGRGGGRCMVGAGAADSPVPPGRKRRGEYGRVLCRRPGAGAGAGVIAVESGDLLMCATDGDGCGDSDGDGDGDTDRDGGGGRANQFDA
ncbi:hypothetical protein B484DRAFT_410885 [Ochromonadaceae sp. CCMP2298]|nr:hypothetical protein B484DRAFT_410885 [Ochromonadaceae sp. CCMP2298]